MWWTLLFVVLCGTLTEVSSWGPVGHRIIARLAQTQLTEKTADWVRSLIPWHWNGNMSVMASWADDILYSDTNPTGFGNWQWTRPLHYINTPDWNCQYHQERDCSDNLCVDGAIRNYTKRLENEFDHTQREEALYFLIHYIGDIHQPLHTAFISDHGGNNIRGRFMNLSTQANLHSLWDSGIMDYRMKKDFSSDVNRYYEHIYDMMLRETSPVTNDDNDIRQWINENLYFVCKQIYFDDENQIMNASMRFNLSEVYYRRSYPIIEQRLIQGGRRLGALLNRLKQTSRSTTKLCRSTYILIIVLAAEFLVSIALGILFFIRYKTKHRQ